MPMAPRPDCGMTSGSGGGRSYTSVIRLGHRSIGSAEQSRRDEKTQLTRMCFLGVQAAFPSHMDVRLADGCLGGSPRQQPHSLSWISVARTLKCLDPS